MHVQALIQYLQGLSDNNNKAWFVMNKPSYDILREEFTQLVATVIAQTAKSDPVIAPVLAKKALFRVHRDLRFSHDKSPYKTTFSAAIANGNKNGSVPMYYFHIDAQGILLMAGGCYLPEKDLLATIRAQIVAEPAAFTRLLKNKKLLERFDGLPGGLSSEDKLLRPPKGYDIDTPHIEFIKLKSFIAVAKMDLNTKAGQDGNHLATEIVKTFVAVQPLILWLRGALKQE